VLAISGSVSVSIFMLRVGWAMSRVCEPKVGYVDINICSYNEECETVDRDLIELN
jgi:hypothetical protein